MLVSSWILLFPARRLLSEPTSRLGGTWMPDNAENEWRACRPCLMYRAQRGPAPEIPIPYQWRFSMAAGQLERTDHEHPASALRGSTKQRDHNH